MGSGWGYEYEYRFLVDEDIIHRYSRFNIRDDIKFLFEMRTNFILKGGDSNSDSDSDEIIDSERFEMGAESSDPSFLLCLFDMRLEDYWFREREMWEFATRAGAFADTAKIAMDGHGCVIPIPIAIEMDVRTVRRFPETLADAKDRAIVSEKLFPLFLMYNRNAFVNVEKSEHQKVSLFLRGPKLCPPDRVNLLECESMDECYVCERGPKIGEQIVILENFCGHSFHYHCFIHSMLKNTSCPRCSYSFSSLVEDEFPMSKFDLV